MHLMRQTYSVHACHAPPAPPGPVGTHAARPAAPPAPRSAAAVASLRGGASPRTGGREGRPCAERSCWSRYILSCHRSRIDDEIFDFHSAVASGLIRSAYRPDLCASRLPSTVLSR